MQQNKGTEKFFNKKSIKALVIGVLTGIAAIILLFLLAGTAVLQMDSYPDKLINYIILGILAVSGFFAGYITGRIYKSSGILYGAVTGIVIFLIVFLAGLSAISDGVTMYTVFKLISLVIPSAIGGILGVNKKEKLHIK